MRRRVDQPRPGDKNSRLVRAYRAARLVVHLGVGLLAGCVLPLMSRAVRQGIIRGWCRAALRVLGVRLVLRGDAPAAPLANALVVANHVSWLDVLMINALQPTRFVAKSEIRAWPVFGWLAQRTRTLFIDRTRRHDTARINGEITAGLSGGECFTVFPEGTTSDGTYLGAFHASLLQPPIKSAGEIRPLALRFVHADGSINRAPAYCGDMSLTQSLRQILAEPVIEAELTFCPPIAAAGRARRVLADEAAAAIASALGLGLARRASGKPLPSPAERPTAGHPTHTRCPEQPDFALCEALEPTSARK